MVNSKYQLTQEARKQFTNLSKITEQLLKQGSFDDPAPVETIVREAPLYLFSKDKTQAALEWLKTEEQSPYEVMLKHPVIVCDDSCAVILLASYRDAYTMSIVSMVSTLLSNSERGRSYVTHCTGELFFIKTSESSNVNQKIKFFNWSLWDMKTSPISHVGNRTDQVGYDFLARGRFQSCTKRALELFSYSLKPRTIVVREGALDKKSAEKSKKKKNNKLPRDHQREVNIVLDPDEVRELQQRAKTGTHASPVAHVRRAHRRVYKHECYKNMRGQVVEIGEVKINVKEGQEIKTPRRIYHVVRVN